MYEINVIEISEEDIQRLIDARDSDNDFWDDIEDIREEIQGDSLVNGFTIVNGANFNIQINGLENKQLVEEFDKTLENHGPYSIEWDPGNYLVFEQWSKGSSRYVFRGKVDLSKLQLDLDDQITPAGEMKTVMTPNYDGEEFELIKSNVTKIRLHIYTEDGEKTSL